MRLLEPNLTNEHYASFALVQGNAKPVSVITARSDCLDFSISF